MRRFGILFCFLTFAAAFCSGRSVMPLSGESQFSIVICSPASDYEGGFGHSAIRVQDHTLHIDVVFNFGMYDENQSFFLYKVLSGTLISSLEGQHFAKFVNYYKAAGRGIDEYYLNLTPEEKNTLWMYLNHLLIQGDRYYKFNIPSNNCTTQIRDVLFEQLHWDPTYFKSRSSGLSDRDIEQKSPLQNSWQHLLFQLVVGPKGDVPISLYEACFSPEELVVLLREVRVNGQPLIVAEQVVLPAQSLKKAPETWITVCCFSVLLLVVLFFSRLQQKKGKSFIWLDRILLFVSGASGLFLWSILLCSEITELTTNYNAMWLLPTNLILAAILRKRNNTLFTIRLARLTCASLLLFPFFALVAGQHIPVEAYLMATALFVRLLFYVKKAKA